MFKKRHYRQLAILSIVVLTVYAFIQFNAQNANKHVHSYIGISPRQITEMPVYNFDFDSLSYQIGDNNFEMRSCSISEDIDCITFEKTVLFVPDTSLLTFSEFFGQRKAVGFIEKLNLKYTIEKYNDSVLGTKYNGYKVSIKDSNGSFDSLFFYTKQNGILLFNFTTESLNDEGVKSLQFERLISTTGQGIFSN